MADSSTLRLYNTLTRQKEDFVPLDPRRVRMYACGPTVYDYAHIGNGRMAVVFDLLFRLLKYRYGEEAVIYVRNITDVDDKINARAARDFPDLALNHAIRKVTEKTAAQYERDVHALGALPPTIEPRATENIPQMQAMIGALLDRGHAYEAGGEVLFDVGSMPDYGRLSRRPLNEQMAGARVAVDAHKRNPEDFVLWKLSSDDEPGWPSPWGRGRPGWHIECSAMADRFLGEVFDIHGGGLDLIFPHHENEIAQSRCAHGTETMARYWVHNGFLQLEGKKMSKSEGNFVTIHDLIETESFGGRKWPGEVVRLALLMTHYREPLDFTVARLEEAEQKLRDWQRAARAATKGAVAPPDRGVLAELLDDLNFHRATVVLDALARDANRRVQAAADSMGATLEFLGFGLDTLLQPDSVSTDMAVDIEVRVNHRLEALNAKDFPAADRIRAELALQGIQLMDYRDDAGDRQTRWEVKQ